MSITDNTNTLRVILDKVKALPDRNGNNETYNLPSNEENVIYDAILAEKTYLQGSPVNN